MRGHAPYCVTIQCMPRQLVVRLDDDLAMRLDARAKELDRPASWIAREALRQLLGAGPKVNKARQKALATTPPDDVPPISARAVHGLEAVALRTAVRLD